MHQADLQAALNALLNWCRQHNFSGHDPFDALNSRLFQATPLNRFQFARLAWTQLLKRSPIDLRTAAVVPTARNAKAIALFALAALSEFRRTKNAETEKITRHLLDELLQMQIKNFSGASWGYSFDWQSRHFFAPKATPMIVPTAFAARALIEAYEVFKEETYLKTARSVCDFVINDLNRTVDTDQEVCFSYSPFDDTCVFNASLLAAETLAAVAIHTGESQLCDLSLRAGRYVVRQQRPSGSWAYGAGSNQDWVDSFHTAYVLISLHRIINGCGDAESQLTAALQRGYQFWRKSFFLADGWPKYYHDTLYPADAHSAATAIVALVELQELDRDALPLAERIAEWTLSNLRDASGYFYYQRRRFTTIRTPFMRWTQAWMAYALAKLLNQS